MNQFYIIKREKAFQKKENSLMMFFQYIKEALSGLLSSSL